MTAAITRSAFLAVATLVAQSAFASGPIGAGTHPTFATLSVGPAMGLNYTDVTQLKFTEEIGYHLSGGASGLALGGSLSQGLGSDFFFLELGPKLWWDIQPTKDLALYLTPTAQLGFGLADGNPMLDMQFGFEVRLVLNDRLLLAAKPFGVDIAAGDFTLVRYDAGFSVGGTF